MRACNEAGRALVSFLKQKPALLPPSPSTYPTTLQKQWGDRDQREIGEYGLAKMQKELLKQVPFRIKPTLTHTRK